MKTMGDLNNILFESIEKLSDKTLTGEKLKAEIMRSDAIQKAAKTIIDNTALTLKAAEYVSSVNPSKQIALPMFGEDV